MRRKTHEEYVAEVVGKSPGVEVVGEYVNARTGILHRCRACRNEWMVRPSDVLKGKGCPRCGGTEKKTHEKYVAEVAEKNPGIGVVGEYVNDAKKSLHRCRACRNEWMVRPNHVLRGKGCPRCGGTEKKTHEKYVAEVAEKNPGVEVVGEYVNARTGIPHYCKGCGHEWMVVPSSILKGVGCPKCGGTEKKTHEKYVAEVAEKNPGIGVVGEYVNARTGILHRCRACGNGWMVMPSSILRGKGCPKCCTIATDADQFYLLIGPRGDDGLFPCKVGITSKRRNGTRQAEGVRKAKEWLGFTPLVNTFDLDSARDFEQQVLSEDYRFAADGIEQKFDGSSEWRLFTQEQINLIRTEAVGRVLEECLIH